jgi:predicted RNA-binding protein with PIN domain
LVKLIEEQDNFIDLKFLKKQNLKEATNRYKICQKFVEYLKQLGYSYDLSFNAFLYPNVKDTRRLLSYLFDIIFQSEGTTTQTKGVEADE